MVIFNIIYTFLESIFEPSYIQNRVITNRVIKRLKCIFILLHLFQSFMPIMQGQSGNLHDFINSSSSSLSSNNHSRCESSFDSGYCASPARISFSELNWSLTDSPFRMDPKMTSRQPLSPQKIVKSETAAGGYFVVSPLKNSNPSSSFSPFKNSTLSPFKLINQSPSKGSFDDWDKDFIASFEENLFGIHDIHVGDLSDSIVGELMKSPQGKAFLEKRNSPVRVGSRSAARKLKVSQQNTTVTDSVIVDVSESGAVATPAIVKVKEEPVEFYTVIKQEPVLETELYCEHNYHAGHTSVLSVTDPNKMDATPVKPSLTYDNKAAPKRKLALRDESNPVCPTEVHSQAVMQQKENFVPAATSFHQWPANNRLKFARAHFKQILEKSVKDKLDKLVVKQMNTSKIQDPKTDLKVKFSNKNKSEKHKSKFSRKASKRDKYPQIKKALAKPSVAAPVCHVTVPNSVFPHVQSKKSAFDPGWYPDDDDTDDDITWHGPMPFQRQTNHGFHGEDDGNDIYVDVDISSDDEYFPSLVSKKRKKSGRGFGKKKRKYY